MSLIARVGSRLSTATFKPICPTGRPDDTTSLDSMINQRNLPTDYDPANPDDRGRKPPTDRVWRLVDEFTALTLLEASDLSNIVMQRFCAKLTGKLSFNERHVIRLTRPPPPSEAESKVAFEAEGDLKRSGISLIFCAEGGSRTERMV